jgi:hypothetical protein
MKHELLKAIQRRTARVAVGPSALRGAGHKGALDAARQFLGDVDLRPFGTSDQLQFMIHLDEATLDLKRSLPKGARHWGLARKALNLYLRDSLYTVYPREAYGLAKAEELFEVPLDSITGTRLSELADGRLPRWKTIKGLDPDLSAEFQQFAAEYAAANKIARVHLDAFWWGGREP